MNHLALLCLLLASAAAVPITTRSSPLPFNSSTSSTAASLPSPHTAPIQKFQKICVTNSAGFVLHWWMKDLVQGTQSQDSGPYPIDKTVCMDIGVLPLIAEGDVVMCAVHADVGETQDCATAVQYASNGYSASFTCTGTPQCQCRTQTRALTLPFGAGTTLQYQCTMNAA